MRQLLSLMGAVLLLSACQSMSARVGSSPPPEGQPLVLGAKHGLRSAILKEERGFRVYLPPDYEKSSERYPVLYLLDGDEHFHHSTGKEGARGPAARGTLFLPFPVGEGVTARRC